MARWGLIGTSLSAAATAMALEVAGEDLVAVAAHRPGDIDDLAAQTGARVVPVESLGELVDVVGVFGRARTQVADALRAVSAGSAVVLGPPVADRADDLGRLERVLAAGGRMHYGEHLLHADAWTVAAREASRIGTLTNLTVRMLRRDPRADLLGTVAHRALALALRLAGAATPVTASVSRSGSTSMQLRVEFDSGLQARVELGRGVAESITDVQAASATGVVVGHLEPDPSVERNGEPLTMAVPALGEHPPALDLLGHVELVRATARAHLADASATPLERGIAAASIALRVAGADPGAVVELAGA